MICYNCTLFLQCEGPTAAGPRLILQCHRACTAKGPLTRFPHHCYLGNSYKYYIVQIMWLKLVGFLLVQMPQFHMGLFLSFSHWTRRKMQTQSPKSCPNAWLYTRCVMQNTLRSDFLKDSHWNNTSEHFSQIPEYLFVCGLSGLWYCLTEFSQ